MVLVSVAACTPQDNPEPETPVTEVPPSPVLPVLMVTEPARAAWSTGPVNVLGSTVAGTGALDSLTVHDVPLSLDATGGFESIIDPPPGIVLVSSRLNDALGERAVDARAVHVGPVRPPGDAIEGAVYLELGRELLDDNDPAPDDVAAVLERLLTDSAFADGLAGQTFGTRVPITLRGLHVAAADVDIEPNDGELAVYIELSDLRMDFTAVAGGSDIIGNTTTEEAEIEVVFGIEAGAQGLVVELSTVSVGLRGFEWETDVLPSSVENIFAATVRTAQEQAFLGALQTQVPEVIRTLLEGFAFEFAVGDSLSLQVDLDIGDLQVTPDSLVMRLDASVETPSGMPLPVGAGSLHTSGAPPPFPSGDWRPVHLAIDDDFLNQLLFATWHSGVLSDLVLSGTELLLLTGEDLPPPLGPVEQITVNLQLPPVLSPSLDLDGSGLFSADLTIGGLVLDIERQDGERVQTSLGVRAGVELGVAGSGIDLALDNRPTAMVVQAGMMTYPEALDPGDLASLFRLSAPGLVGGALDFLPALPTPSVDLGALSSASSLQGVVWTMTEAEVEMQESGWLVLSGRME